MKRIHFLMIFYVVAIVALFAQSYCREQALQYFDFKAAIGDNQPMAEWWLERAEWAFLVGFASAILGSAFAPFQNKWENVALEICTICAYFLISVFV